MSVHPVSVPGSRPLVVLPRQRGYTHRPIIAVADGVGVTEHGEVVTNLASFALTDPHIWITHDPTELLNYMLEHFRDFLTYTFTESRDPEIELTLNSARLATFGFAPDSIFSLTYAGARRKALHTVWHPSRMFSTPRMAADMIGGTHQDLLRFAVDVRDWCKQENIPLRASLPSIAAALMRDKRFWPNPRGRVPRATNERIRRYLPGVYQERRAPLNETFPTAIALDQSRAYHRVAQQVPLPDTTNLYARGYFNDPDNAPELWAPADSELYKRTISQPGIVAVIASGRPVRKGEWRAPVCDGRERRVRYLWTNELDTASLHGLTIEGIVAAWTSDIPDDGIAAYGKWAESQIDSADAFRQQWLKPTLHALYGLLGSRPRDLYIGRRYGSGTPDIITVRGYAYPVNQTAVPASAPSTTNVAALGMLQAEIRQRTLELANHYSDDVLHVHADGMHLRARQLHFLPEGWTAETVTALEYLDDVSWISDERDVLPGRDAIARLNLRKRIANGIASATLNTIDYPRFGNHGGGSDQSIQRTA